VGKKRGKKGKGKKRGSFTRPNRMMGGREALQERRAKSGWGRLKTKKKGRQKRGNPMLKKRKEVKQRKKSKKTKKVTAINGGERKMRKRRAHNGEE